MGRRERGAKPWNARVLATEVLQQIEVDEAYSHVALDSALRRRSLSPRERGLATRIVYGTLAWQRRLDAELSIAARGDVTERTDPFTRAALRGALYQLRHLDRVPSHAVVNETVALVKAERGKGAAGFTNAVLRRLARSPLELKEPEDAVASFGLRHSLPDEIVRAASARFDPPELERWAIALNDIAPLTVRVNLSRGSTEALTEQLNGAKCTLAPDALHLPEMTEAVQQALSEGRCVVQDEGAQLVVHFAGALPMGGAIWDVCAGQGGKTRQLVDAVKASGSSAKIVATDLHAAKLDRLEDALRQDFGGVEVEVQAFDARTLPEAYRERFELVVLDAPCSGLGLMRRHPETRWRRAKTDVIASLAKLQRGLLDSVAAAVSPGGVLLYAVCTNTDEETWQQVDRFLADHPSFRLAAPVEGAVDFSDIVDAKGQLELWPHRQGTDGFFAARFEKGA